MMTGMFRVPASCVSFRVAWNVVSVADPLYTGPFLLCLIIASFYRRGSRLRTRFNWAGIIISSLYLLFCTYNHFRVNQIFEDVERNGDTAIQKYTSLFDGVDLPDYQVSEEEIEIASNAVSDELKQAIQTNIEQAQAIVKNGLLKN